jgi:hypothetical protein
MIEPAAPGASAARFLLAYVAFISLYEVGYLANDLLAFREEGGGRGRLGDAPPGAALVAGAVVVRSGVFVGATWLLGLLADPRWWAFYALLASAFTVHNLLRSPALRLVSFVHLALSRFYAPIFAFLGGPSLALLAAPVLLHYVLLRALGYLESKGISNIPGRGDTAFKVRYYAVLVAPSCLLTILTGSWIPVAFNAWYLAAWTGAWALGLGRGRAARLDG